MKPKNVVTVNKSGAIYIPKLTTKQLGIFGWAGVVIAVEEKYIYMRFYKHSITPKTGELIIKLQKKSGGRNAMTGHCLKFVELINNDFGHTMYLDLHIETIFFDEESVRISLNRPSRKDEGSTPEYEDAAKKEDQAKVARWIKDNGCAEVSCRGDKGSGRFDGVICPLLEQSGGCGHTARDEMFSAEMWLKSNGYLPDQETQLGTISNPAEKQLNIFDLPINKSGNAPRTRPMPDGLPEWLSGPLSRGEQVRAVASHTKEKKKGWAFGAFIDQTFGKERPMAVIIFDSSVDPTSILVAGIEPCIPTIKPAAECLAIAKELKIGLSSMQIEAISNGGIPPAGHGLPDEMFE